MNQRLSSSSGRNIRTRRYPDSGAQGLKIHAVVLGGGQEHLDELWIRSVCCLEGYVTSHLLKTDRDFAVDLQAPTDINIGYRFPRE